MTAPEHRQFCVHRRVRGRGRGPDHRSSQSVRTGLSPIGAGSGACPFPVRGLRHLGPPRGRDRHRCRVSTLWLLRGMAEDGIITSIDIELEHQRVARETLTAGEIAPAGSV